MGDHPTLTRRHLLATLLAAAAWPAGATTLPSTSSSARSWGGRGRVRVLATAHGDPRLARGADGTHGLNHCLRFVEQGATTFVAATGTRRDEGLDKVAELPMIDRRRVVEMGLAKGVPDDAARLVDLVVDGVHLVETGHGERRALYEANTVYRRLVRADDDTFGRRRVAMARGRATEAEWGAVRASGLRRVGAAREAVEEALQRHVHTVAELVSQGHEPVVVTHALVAPELASALAEAGLAGELHATPPAAEVLDDAPLWWAAMLAGLPDPTGAGLADWADALAPFADALRAWPGLAAAEAGIREMVGPAPPPLLRSDPRARAVRRAQRLLKRTGLPHEIPTGLASSDSEVLGMSYDALHDVVTVSAAVADLPTPLVAAMLHHELVHVREVADAAARWSATPLTFALVVDLLPLGIGLGVRCTMEDVAYRDEVRVMGRLGVDLDSTGLADGPRADVVDLLATLKAAPYGSAAWLQLVDRLVLPPG
jgi:hypothetical protein